MTDKEKIIAEIDKIIDRLKTRCNPNPLGTTEECLVAGEIEVLELVKGIIAKMKEEEPINEDLLDEIHNRWEDDPHTKWPKCPYKDFKNIAFHFANWQKERDADLGSPAYERGYHDGREYEKGKADKKKEMLKDAVEIEYWDGSLFCNELREKYKDGDKVKIIIIKED